MCNINVLIFPLGTKDYSCHIEVIENHVYDVDIQYVLLIRCRFWTAHSVEVPRLTIVIISRHSLLWHRLVLILKKQDFVHDEVRSATNPFGRYMMT